MSSPCTGPQRLFRCRVRDLASCFYACRLPLEEDQLPDKSCSKSPKMSGGSIVLEFDGAGNGSRKMSTANKIKKSLSSSSTTSHREPRFAEEEYIVFCFREDGEIDVVNEEIRSSEKHDGNTAAVTSRKDTQDSGEEKRKNENENENENETGRVYPICEEEANPTKMERLESSDSNRSDTSTSTGSFAFPVLGIEWIGSPVHMPKSEKQSASLHCCRF